jgi:glyoxylase-like metal-dependent hydrolase (beta-lactamase superfamily II)/8-oxo-dGTP pyrophosphatase MutT (NUDIX family)
VRERRRLDLESDDFVAFMGDAPPVGSYDSPVSTPRPAATVVLLRDRPFGLEVLLTHRPASMAFAPDVHVFPGGRVDEVDLDPTVQSRSVITPDAAKAALGGDLPPVDALGAFIAAIREAFEEVGILLADHRPGADLGAARNRLLESPGAFGSIASELDLHLRTDLLVPLSRWVTPPILERRFDARFFAAMAPDGIEASLVGEEVVAHAWHRPVDALESMATGELSMWLPTSTTLMQLLHATSIDEVRSTMAPGRLEEVEVEAISDDVVRIEMPAGGGVAGQPTNAYLVGREQFVLIDPGDPTGPALDRAVGEAARRGGRIVAIVLTSAEPDHAAGAESLREQLDIEVFVGPSGGRYLPYPVNEIGEAGAVIDVGDVPLHVVATPGLEPEGLAFVVGDGRFALVSDLDSRRGARSIFGPVDEVAVDRSIARLREVAPDARWLGGHPPLDWRP